MNVWKNVYLTVFITALSIAIFVGLATYGVVWFLININPR
jgi:hypothetical protein